MGGLATAARLARQRHDVTVLEQAAVVGGKLGTFSRDGFTFDTGPSLLTLPAVYRDLWRKTGRPLERELDLVPVDPVCHYRFADGTELDVPNARPGAMRAALDGALGAGAGADWDAFLARAGEIWRATRQPFLESALAGPTDLLRHSVRLGDLATVAPWRTLRGLGRHYLRHPHLRTYLDRYATYTGSDPRRAPAALAVVPYVEQAFGAWHVSGGLRRLGDALHERVQRRGGLVRTGCRVVEITTDGARVTGVRLAGGELLAADVVVANADAARVYGELLPDPSVARLVRAARRSLARSTPSLGGLVLLLAVDGRTPGLRHHTVLFPDDYDDEFDSVFGAGRDQPWRRRRPARPAPDPAVYVCAPDDPALRPGPDAEAWFVLVNAPRHGDPARDPTTVDWTAAGLADGYADRVLDLMGSRGLDVRDRVRWRVVRTPADLERETGAPGGAIYGTSSNGARSAFLRPANRSPLPGLFLVGGSAHPGGGLPLVGMGAAIVAGLVGPA
jgi:phytoene desaturase